MSKKYFGKYRGQVTNNIDSEMRGRLLVTVPKVFGQGVSSWALPCFPISGMLMGSYLVPPSGASVWVEFEGGDPQSPIWTGCFWNSRNEVPPLAKASKTMSPNIVFQTVGQYSLVMSDLDGITLQSAPGGPSININKTGITIENGKGGARIVMKGKSIDMNEGAFKIKF
jgi:uncharacterized protein involved in type VI secretion and phage assembly